MTGGNAGDSAGRPERRRWRSQPRWRERAARRPRSWIARTPRQPPPAPRPPRKNAATASSAAPGAPASTGRTAGPHGQGPHLRAPLDHARASIPTTRSPGRPDRRHRQRVGQARLRAEGRRGPEVLEPARDERRRQQVLPRPRRHAGARDQRPPADRPGRQHDRRPGRRPSTTSRRDADLADLPGRADPSPRPPEDELQLAGLVQRRDRGEAAVLAPASSTRSRTRCPRSWTSPRPRRCSSSSARAPAAT